MLFATRPVSCLKAALDVSAGVRAPEVRVEEAEVAVVSEARVLVRRHLEGRVVVRAAKGVDRSPTKTDGVRGVAGPVEGGLAAILQVGAGLGEVPEVGEIDLLMAFGPGQAAEGLAVGPDVFVGDSQ
jgi:hypothetical protein